MFRNLYNIKIMNALAVQNPRYKCDLGNKNDSVTDKKITTDNINNYYNNYYYTEIILYLCVRVTTYSPSPTWKRSVKMKTWKTVLWLQLRG